MKKKNTLFFIIVIIVFFSCNENNLNGHISENTKYDLKQDSIFMFDTSKMSMDERLKKLTEISRLKKFDKERTNFIEKDINNVFKVGEIQKKGSTYQYNVTCDEHEIALKYICTPNAGEYNMYVVGEDSIVNIFYKKIKIGQKWDECYKSNNDESCSSTKQIEIYPVKTYFKFDYLKVNKKISQLTFIRKDLYQNNNK